MATFHSSSLIVRLSASAVRASVLLALVVPVGLSAHAKPKVEGLETLAIQPAQQAVSVGEVVAAWSPDLRSVLGFDLGGKRLWRLPTGDQGGIRDLVAHGDNVLAYAGTEALVIEPTSGKVLGRRANVALLGPGDASTDWCRIESRDGVCAKRCACSFELVDCDTLATLGPSVQLSRFEELDPDGARTTHCPLFSGALLGRSGDALIASFPVKTDKPFFGVPDEVTAVSASTGKVLWRAPDFGRFEPELSGVAGDGKTCFVGSRAGSLIVFDCQRASPKWQRTISIIKGIETQVGALPQSSSGPLGLLVRDGANVLALELGSGSVLWSKALTPRSVALTDPPPTSGAPHRFAVARDRKVETATLYEAATGKVIAELPMPVGTRTFPVRKAWGWLAQGESELVAFGPAGATLMNRGLARNHTPISAGAHLLVASDQKLDIVQVAPGNAGTSIPATTVSGQLGRARPIALVEQSDGLAVVLLREGKSAWDASDPETFGELHFMRLR
jgi:hypothetical protein